MLVILPRNIAHAGYRKIIWALLSAPKWLFRSFPGFVS
jgi:hypothetical protein